MLQQHMAVAHAHQPQPAVRIECRTGTELRFICHAGHVHALREGHWHRSEAKQQEQEQANDTFHDFEPPIFQLTSPNQVRPA